MPREIASDYSCNSWRNATEPEYFAQRRQVRRKTSKHKRGPADRNSKQSERVKSQLRNPQRASLEH
ncbi:MAG: hypothetical protein HW419_4214 [Deltaproteobacteria bacterium]|nr:hypothetical protein [Deltaproteobacteria bacterium]